MSVLQRNNVHVHGEGPPMVFVHGFGCDQNMWRLLAPHFAESHTCILLDLVGSGQSDLSAYDPPKYATLHGYAADLCEVLAAVTSAPAICVGHSVSAMIGMLAGIKAPERFLAQVMIAPSPCYIDDGDYRGGFSRGDIDELLDTMEANYLGWSSAMAPVIMGAPNLPHLGIELTNSFCRNDPDIARHFGRVTFLSDHRADLADATLPTLILQCSDDLIAPREVGAWLRELLACRLLQQVQNVGHNPQMSSPQEYLSLTQAFLDQQGLQA
jgi:sigma-B regulation protein RsbQ